MLKLPGIRNHEILRFRNGSISQEPDPVSLEEPLEIYVDGMPYAVTMRMPGDDLNLAAGFCLTEGIITRAENIDDLAPCDKDESRILIELTPEAASHTARGRMGFVSKSSCGLCGKEKLADIHSDIPPIEGNNPLSFSQILALKDQFERKKAVFPITGSTHSAALFTHSGECLAFAEDVGRHNALDKAIGRALLEGTIHGVHTVLVSSRLSFEMVQKATVIGAQILAGVSAATSMAADFAAIKNLTLIGFLRKGRMNVYSGQERIISG